MTQSRKGGQRKRRRPRGSAVGRFLIRSAIALTVVLAGALSVAFLDANWRFARHGPPPPVRLYSAPFVFREGTPLSASEIGERLARLGYRKVEGKTRTPGEYARRFHSYEIALNRFDYPEGTAEPHTVRVKISSTEVTDLEDVATGRNIEMARLEPEPLGVLSGDVREERVPVTLRDVPRALQDAVVAVEDRRFRSHPGIDLKGVLRALVANLRSGQVVQGGSTVTQQLAKNLYPGHENRTMARKVWESLAALSLEMAHSKDEIMERYLNEIYLAQRGPMAIIGVGAAARHYFGKEARYLDLPESALLAGLIQSPGHYHPYRNPSAARERRDLVLDLMRREGLIDETARRAAAAAPLGLRPEPSRDSRSAPYFVDYVAEALRRGGAERRSTEGLRVFTTLDPYLQARAESSLESRLAAYEKEYRHLRRMPGGGIQGAVLVLRPSNGAILAMVGGRDYQESQFNRAVQAHRQPGSLFKPFVYLAGFQEAQEAGDSRFTAATLLDDSPLEMEMDGKLWAPHNFDEEFRGPVTARQALAYSLNVPTIRAAESIGLQEVVRTAHRCGIESELQPVPSLALGTFEVTPLEIASAFTTFATLGEHAAPWAVTSIVGAGGRVESIAPPEIRRDTTPQAAYVTLDLMRDVVRYGTGASIAAYGLNADFAGKTGTTDDGRDAWFVGFNPSLLALVWVGFDNNRPLRLGGSTLALPIWADVISRAGYDPEARWEPPEGLTHAEVDPSTGKLATWNCPDSVEEIFIAGTEPTEPCEHGTGDASWAHRLFRWLRRNP